MAWSYERIDWTATAAGAAWAQAILTVAAVGATAWLQDRGFAKRMEEDRVRRLEGIGAIARFAHHALASKFESFSDGMDPVAAVRLHRPTDLDPILRAVATVEPVAIDDITLAERFLHMTFALSAADQALSALHDRARAAVPSGATVDARSIMLDMATLVLESAAAVEQRVATLTNRTPALSN